MIIIPDGARKKLSTYIKVFDKKASTETSEEYKKYYTDVLQCLQGLQMDLQKQETELFQGVRVDIMKNFISFLHQFDVVISTEESYKYFSNLTINPGDFKMIMESEDYDIKEIRDFILNPMALWSYEYGELDGFNREFRVVTALSQIPEKAQQLPTDNLKSVELYYETVGIQRQLTIDEWNEYLKYSSSGLAEIYQEWYGVSDKGLYYVLIDNA